MNDDLCPQCGAYWQCDCEPVDVNDMPADLLHRIMESEMAAPFDLMMGNAGQPPIVGARIIGPQYTITADGTELPYRFYPNSSSQLAAREFLPPIV